MEPGIRTEYREIIDLCMACESTKARNDRAVPDLAIMPDMSAIHEIVVVTDTRAAPAECGAHVDRDLFSNLCPFTDFETRRFAIEGPVLWLGPEARIREDPTIRTDRRSTDQRDMCSDFDPRPEFYVATYEGERTDHDVRGQNRSVFDACGRMDVGQGLSPFR
jgi:hypothetical protein